MKKILLCLSVSTISLFADPVVYVANNQDNSISIFDTTTNTVIQYVNNNGFSIPNPIDLRFLPDLSKGYVVSVNEVSVIDPVAREITGRVNSIANPFNAPAVLGLIPSQNKIYVTNEGSNQVSIIDTITDTVTGYVNPSTFPFFGTIGVFVSPDQTKAYVTNFNSHGVSIIDTATDTVTGYVTNPISFPFNLPTLGLFVSNAKAYVSNAGGGNVSIIDATTNTVTGYINHTFGNPENIILSPDGTLAYIVDDGLNQVVIVNAATDAVVGTLSGSFSSPLGMAFSPDAAFLYIGNAAGNNVSIVNLTSNMQTGIVNPGAFPFDSPYQFAPLYTPVPVQFAPASISGNHKKNRFATQYEWYNEIRWMPSLGTNIIHYNVYRNGSLVTSINARDEFVFQDHNISKRSVYTYSVTAVRQDFLESTSITITLGP